MKKLFSVVAVLDAAVETFFFCIAVFLFYVVFYTPAAHAGNELNEGTIHHITLQELDAALNPSESGEPVVINEAVVYGLIYLASYPVPECETNFNFDFRPNTTRIVMFDTRALKALVKHAVTANECGPTFTEEVRGKVSDMTETVKETVSWISIPSLDVSTATFEVTLPKVSFVPKES